MFLQYLSHAILNPVCCDVHLITRIGILFGKMIRFIFADISSSQGISIFFVLTFASRYLILKKTHHLFYHSLEWLFVVSSAFSSNRAISLTAYRTRTLYQGCSTRIELYVKWLILSFFETINYISIYNICLHVVISHHCVIPKSHFTVLITDSVT